MTQSGEILLRAGPCAAGVAPAFGAATTFLTVDDAPILRAGSLDDIRNDPRNAACFPCAPYFGRIAGALEFAGSKYPMATTLAAADPAHALHGEGWISPWSVEALSENALTLALEHTPGADGAFPFAYAARQTVSLSPSGATFSLSLKNKGDSAMPAGLGLHPYFHRTRETRASFTGRHFWTPPGPGAPGRFSPPPDALGGGAPAPLPFETRDHSYAGFAGEAIVSDAYGAVRLTSAAPILHLFAPAGEDYFCLEPVSHAPGALVDPENRYGGRRLGPGETMSIALTVSRQQ